MHTCMPPAKWPNAILFMLFLSAFIPGMLSGQNLDRIRVDEMRKVWYATPTPESDNKRLYAGIYLLNEYDEFNPDSLACIVKEMLDYGTKNGKKLWIAQAWFVQGKYYYGTVGDIDKAIFAYRTALRYLGSTDSLYAIKVHGELGTSFRAINLLDSAIIHLEYAATLARKFPPELVLANIFGSLGKCYDMQGNYVKALELYTESQKQEVGNIKFISTYNIGLIFKKLELRKEAKKQFLEALRFTSKNDRPRNLVRSYAAKLQLADNLATARQYLEEGLALADSLNLTRPVLFLLSEAGQLFVDSLQLDRAAFYLNKCLNLATALKDEDRKNRSMLLLAKIHCLKGEYRQALKTCLAVQPYFEKNSSGESFVLLCDILSKSYEALGQIKQALYFLQKKDLANAVFNNTAAVKEYVTAFLTFKSREEQTMLLLEKNNAEALAAESKARERLSFWAIGLLSLLLTAVVAFFFIFYRLKARAARHLALANSTLQSEKVKLEYSNTRLRRFSNVVSHDILSNLDLMLSSGNVLVGNAPKPERLLRYYKMVHQISAQLKTYCLDLLEEARQVHPTNSHTPNPVLQSVYQRFEPALRAKNFRVDLENLPPVLLPPVVMEQLFQNLISNALRHASTADSPWLHIGCGTDEQGRKYFVVEDNGPGIPESRAELIFQGELQQNPNGSDQKIGLSLLKQTLREYNADIRVEQRPGGGARFMITFGEIV
jgi:signal transduction histidine kinase